MTTTNNNAIKIAQSSKQNIEHAAAIKSRISIDRSSSLYHTTLEFIWPRFCYNFRSQTDAHSIYLCLYLASETKHHKKAFTEIKAFGDKRYGAVRHGTVRYAGVTEQPFARPMEWLVVWSVGIKSIICSTIFLTRFQY